MKSLISFTKKEFFEHFRSAKLYILSGLFLLFAVMSPLLAYLTPELVTMLSESMTQSGMQLTVTEVTAMDSWVQFVKNIPIALIVFIILESNIFTKEYQKGTLVLALTKGLKRYKVIVAKTVTMLALWTAGFFLCFGITYAVNNYVWDNSVAKNLGFMAFCWWLFGVMAICLSVLFSVIAKTNIIVLAGTGGLIFVSYLAGMLPKIGEYMPTLLMNSNSLIYGLEEPQHYVAAIIITTIVSVISITLSVPVFNKKHI